MQLKLAAVHLDRYDFHSAARHLKQALHLGVASQQAREDLARCNNMLGCPEAAVAVLATLDGANYQRGYALEKLGQVDEAEAEYKAVLLGAADHRHACRMLNRLFRRGGRVDEVVSLCEDLHARGANHAQLFYDWGIGLALTGDVARARCILVDARRIERRYLSAANGFPQLQKFNEAVAESLLTSPDILSSFPMSEDANRGSRRVHSLFVGGKAELFRSLVSALQGIVDDYHPDPYFNFDPWPAARPRAAHLRAWGLIQRNEDYETWHIHRGGWLSGVYYVRVPTAVARSVEGHGAIEYGASDSLQESAPGLVEPQRFTPQEGMLLMAPSHYPHRTIASGIDEYRISFAFDVVPDG